jgi:hypothetical protein
MEYFTLSLHPSLSHWFSLSNSVPFYTVHSLFRVRGKVVKKRVM